MRSVMAKATGYMKPTIDPSLRLYVPFNEGIGSVAKDYSQYGNHAQLTDVEWTIGIGGNAGKFNRNSSLGDCGNDASLNITNQISVESWIYITELGRTQAIVSTREGTTNMKNHQYTLHFWSTSKFMFARGDGTHQQPVYSATTYGIGRHHIVGLSEGNKIRIYVTADVNEANMDYTPTSNFDGVKIGKYNSTDITYQLNGTIDEARISALVKSAAQIAADRYELPQFTGPFYNEGALLLETGDNLLLETGDNLLLN